jgi:hypothetical protein
LSYLPFLIQELVQKKTFDWKQKTCDAKLNT